MWKAICTDIDGTLLNADRRLSERTIQAFKKIKDEVPIILASSRMPAAMRHLQEEIGITDQPLICYNGGYIIDQKDEVRIITSLEIPFTWMEKVVLQAIEINLHASIYYEDEWYAPQRDLWTDREENNTRVKARIVKSEDMLKVRGGEGKGAHKIMLMGDSDKIDAVVSKLEKEQAPMYLYRSKDTYLEIASNAISKATALQQLSDQILKIDLKDMMAFGDNYNDIDMLKAVGNGVAVGNARDEVKAIADELTATGKEDGVARIIEKYFF